MLKKLIIGSVVVLGIGFFLVGPAIFGHVHQLFRQARAGIQNALPLEYELERAEGLLEEIGPEIEDAQKVVAREQVEIRYLKGAIAKLKKKQSADAGSIQARSRLLKVRRVSFTIAGRRYQRQRLENELDLAFTRFKRNQKLLEGKQSLLAAREKALVAAQSNVLKAASDRDLLRTRIEDLRARVREEEALADTHEALHLNTGSLADIRGILSRCQKRLDVMRQLRENRIGSLVHLSEEDAASQTDVISEVERYFHPRAVKGAKAEEASSVLTTPLAISSN